MKDKLVLTILCFFLLAGCAGREDTGVARQPKKLITQEDYQDFEMNKPRNKKPIEVDYQKEGVYQPSINTKRR